MTRSADPLEPLHVIANVPAQTPAVSKDGPVIGHVQANAIIEALEAAGYSIERKPHLKVVK